MKTLLIILSTLLLNYCLVAAETPLVSIDSARIQNIAVKAIKAKYPDLKSEDLSLGSIAYLSVTGHSDSFITVDYTLTLVTKQEGGSITRTQNIHVALSDKGVVREVFKGKVLPLLAQ